jgi:hypothetical protein
MVQAVSRRPLAAECQVRVRVSPCGTSGGQSGTGTSFFGFPLSISFQRGSPYSYVLWRMNNMYVSGRSSEI